jgi:predicted PurR-regulated permease PerM
MHQQRRNVHSVRTRGARRRIGLEWAPVAPKSQVSFRTVVTVCVAVLVVAAVVYAITLAQVAITLALLAAMVAIALDHGVQVLMRHGLKRWLAVLLVGLALLGVGVLLGVLLVPPAVSQAQVMARELPQLLDTARHTEIFGTLDRSLGLSAAIDRLGQGAPALILRALNALLALMGGVVTTLLLAVFMVIFGGPLIARVLEEVEPSRRPQLRTVLDSFYRSVGAYIAGAALIALINSVITATFLAILRMPFFLPLAILSGFSSLVPFVGSIVTSIAISVLALATMGPLTALACAVYFVTYGQIEGNLFSPLIFRRTVHLNPLITTLSVLFFGEMGGVIGALVAIPIVATLQIVLAEVLRARHASWGQPDPPLEIEQ